MKRYSAGRVIVEDDGTWYDFYYDTQFESREEAEVWGIEHECTHTYDAVTREYKKIEEE